MKSNNYAIPKYIKGMESEKIINNLKNRFFSKLRIPNDNGCMEWIGAYRSKRKSGCHGVMCINYKNIPAHRYSYKLFSGEIPEGFLVCHSCDNPKCCAPNHLFLGTHKDNSQDMVKKGRASKQIWQKENQSKLTKKQEKIIEEELKKGIKGKDLSKKFNVSESFITKIKNKGNRVFNRLTKEKIILIKEMLKNGINQPNIARKLNIHQSTVSLIKSNME